MGSAKQCIVLQRDAMHLLLEFAYFTNLIMQPPCLTKLQLMLLMA